ncbi:MAG: sigma-70 family RNA polymerase sigma factor [Bacilli bacterium]|nr:sigma-70 family RNA polymerase sigma factor [Bacilli bacterium]
MENTNKNWHREYLYYESDTIDKKTILQGINLKALKTKRSGQVILTDNIEDDFLAKMPKYESMPLAEQQRMLKLMKMAYYNGATPEEQQQYIEYFCEECPKVKEKLSLDISEPEKSRIINEMISIAMETRSVFIKRNISLVCKYAFSLRWCEIPVIDLIQEGIIGMMTAIRKFDLKKGCRFSTYAVLWIKQAIDLHINLKERMIKIPVEKLIFMKKVKTVEKELFTELKIEPTNEQIAERLKTSVQKVENAKIQMLQIETFEKPIKDEENSTLGEFIADKESDFTEFVHNQMIKEQLMKILDDIDLSDEEKTIICMRYGLIDDIPRTLRYISEKIGSNIARVRYAEQKILERLKTNAQIRQIYDETVMVKKKTIN